MAGRIKTYVRSLPALETCIHGIIELLHVHHAARGFQIHSSSYRSLRNASASGF